jgi:putative ABC transport system substrate-binding protein
MLDRLGPLPWEVDVSALRVALVLVLMPVLLVPPPAGGQPAGKVHRIGLLGAATLEQYRSQIDALRSGLRDLGHVEGKNLVIEFRWAEGRYERLPALAAELVRLNVDVIVTHGTPGSLAAKQATSTIPIVMAVVGNPVEDGLVAGFARPGGNITGSAFFYPELNAKRVELLKDAFPRLARVAVLVNPGNPANASALRAVQERARALNLKTWVMEVRRLEELDAAFAAARPQADALTVLDDGLFIANPGPIADLAKAHRLPSVGFKEYGDAGGLLVYAVDFPDMWRRSMALVDRILRGARPQDLPIQQATRFELAINMRTARSLGLAIPPPFLARVDKVIE